MLASISEVIDGDWLRLEPVRVGQIPAALGTPARYVTVTHRERPTLRVDVYAYGPDCFAFEDAIVWRDILIVGFGSHVHAIPIATRSAVTIPLGAYYCHLYPTENYLLIASGRNFSGWNLTVQSCGEQNRSPLMVSSCTIQDRPSCGARPNGILLEAGDLLQCSPPTAIL